MPCGSGVGQFDRKLALVKGDRQSRGVTAARLGDGLSRAVGGVVQDDHDRNEPVDILSSKRI